MRFIKREKGQMAKKILNVVLKTITWIIVIAVVAFAVALVGVKIFGVQVYTVLSGSMEPVYHTGSVIYVVDADPSQLKEGDDITFRLSESTTATHRIIEVLTDESDPDFLQFRTQGVANEVEDATPVDKSQVIGKPVFTIPYLGYVAAYIQQPPGLYVGLSVGASLLLIVVIIELLTSDDGEKKKKNGKDTAEEKPSEEKAPEEGNEEEKEITEDKPKGEKL